MNEADVEVVESPIQTDDAVEVGETDLLKAALEADREHPGEGATAAAPALPGVAERSAARIAKAAAAEEARVERRAARLKLDEADRLLNDARGRAARLEEAAAARLQKAEEYESERERARRLIQEKGIEGLEELGYDYATLAAAELDRLDPQAIAKKAAAEVAALRKEIADRDRAEQERQRSHALSTAVQRDRAALVEFAEKADETSPVVAHLARAARSDARAARLLIEAADEVKDLYVEQAGRLPYMHEVVAELDARLRFLQASAGTGQAQAPVPSQAMRTQHQRTLGSPAVLARPSALRRELTEEELLEQQAAALREALAADRTTR